MVPLSVPRVVGQCRCQQAKKSSWVGGLQPVRHFHSSTATRSPEKYRGSGNSTVTGDKISTSQFWSKDHITQFINGEKFALPSKIQPFLLGLTPRVRKEDRNPQPTPHFASFVPDEAAELKRLTGTIDKDQHNQHVFPMVDLTMEPKRGEQGQGAGVWKVSLPLPRKAKIDPLTGESSGKGGRKSSVATVWIKKGTGLYTINQRPMAAYFRMPSCRETVVLPLLLTETIGQFDVKVKVEGGGFTGQSGAIRMGLSRALQNWDPAWRHVLKRAGFLERDERIVERKKPGQKKARKKFQWVKR